MKPSLLLKIASMVVLNINLSYATENGPAHHVANCPTINGQYVQDSGVNRKTIKTQKTTNGLNFEDTEVKWIVDGITHSVEGGPQLSYRGSCERNSIVLTLYQETTQVGRMIYFTNDKSQLVIETMAIDSRLGQSGKEIWNPEKQ